MKVLRLLAILHFRFLIVKGEKVNLHDHCGAAMVYSKKLQRIIKDFDPWQPE